MPLIHTPPGNRTHNLGTCPNQESNLKPFGLWMILQPTKPPYQGWRNLLKSSLLLIEFILFLKLIYWAVYISTSAINQLGNRASKTWNLLAFRGLKGWEIPILRKGFPTVENCHHRSLCHSSHAGLAWLCPRWCFGFELPITATANLWSCLFTLKHEQKGNKHWDRKLNFYKTGTCSRNYQDRLNNTVIIWAKPSALHLPICE